MQQEITEEQIKKLESIVLAEQDRLFRSAYLRVGNRADAEDIVQDVLLRLLSAREYPTHVLNMSAYLIRAIDNACKNWHRDKHAGFMSIEEATAIPCPAEDSDIHEEYLRISRLLEQLPPEQAETVRLKCIDGLKFREIATLLDIPESTAKSRYHYAIENIQKRLNH